MGSGSSLMIADLESCTRRRDRPSHLVQRILHRDWNAVLARIKSHPKEVLAEFNMKVYGTHRTHVTPLHLICALRPPLKVVDAMIRVDTGHAATVFIRNDKKLNLAQKQIPSTPSKDRTDTQIAEKVRRGKWKSDSALQMRSKRFFERRRVGGSDSGLAVASARSRSSKSARSFSSFNRIHRSQPSSSGLGGPSMHSPFEAVADDDGIFGGYSPPGLLDQVVLLAHSASQPSSAESDFQHESMALIPESMLSQTIIEEDDMDKDESYFQVRDQRDSKRNQSTSNEMTSPSTSTRQRSSQMYRRGGLTRRISERSFQGGTAVVDSSSSHWLPLHVACLFRTSPEVILALIRACPWAAKVMNGMGMLPIHIVCAGIEEPPPLVKQEPHAMVKSNADWNLTGCVHLLLRAFPDSIFMTSSNLDDMRPRQYAEQNLSRGEEKDIVKKLLNIPVNQFEPIVSLVVMPKVHSIRYDEITNKTKSKELNEGAPTKLWHHISRREWRHALIRTSRAPQEVSVWTMVDDETTSGTSCYRLALHKACSLRPPLALVQALVNTYPKSVSTREKFAMLPLHVACAFRADVSVISFLITSNPSALKTVDAWGRFPLHVAAVAGTTLQTLHVLLEAYPQATQHVDKKGRTPADCVQMSRSSEKDLLLTALRAQSILLKRYSSMTIANILEDTVIKSDSSGSSFSRSQ
jgi:hypothetical protein